MMMIEGKSVMVVSRGVAAGLETALVLAGGHATQDGGEMDASPHITMVCKVSLFDSEIVSFVTTDNSVKERRSVASEGGGGRGLR